MGRAQYDCLGLERSTHTASVVPGPMNRGLIAAPLAARAEPGSAPGDSRLRDRAAAALARLSLASVDAELVLHRAGLAVRERVVAQRRSSVGDAQREYLADCSV